MLRKVRWPEQEASPPVQSPILFEHARQMLGSLVADFADVWI